MHNLLQKSIRSSPEFRTTIVMLVLGSINQRIPSPFCEGPANCKLGWGASYGEADLAGCRSGYNRVAAGLPVCDESIGSEHCRGPVTGYRIKTILGPQVRVWDIGI